MSGESSVVDRYRARLDRALNAFSERAMGFGDRYGWHVIGVSALVGAALPVVGLQEGFYMSLVSEMFLFAVLALSWDLIGGQTGYPSFGQMAFFGIGAYTTAILFKDFSGVFPSAVAGDPLLLLLATLIAAGLLATVAAGLIGMVVLRLRGGYFAIATLGILLAIQQVTRNLEITGGASGKILFEGPTGTQFYYLFLGLLVAEVVVVYYLSNTRFGYVLNAIRDDEEKAVAMGVNTAYYKTAAWMIAALFTGLVGGTWSLFNTFVNPMTAYNGAWNVELIAMALLGGSGTVLGPVLGGFGLHFAVVQIDALFSGWQLVVLGSVVIGTVILFPQGIVGAIEERASAMEYYRHGGQAAEESSDGTDQPVADGGTDDTTGGANE